jgi:phospholipid/cholesterol/gamma-HCH transport system ATP-binding protein
MTTEPNTPLSRVRRKMGFLFQDAALFDSITLYENLALPLLRLTTKTQEEIDSMIDKVQGARSGRLGDRQEKNAFRAFGRHAEARRAGTRALVLEPKILLADEPSSGLDRITTSEIDELLLQQKAERQTTLIVVTHHVQGPVALEIVLQCSIRGQLVSHGTAAEVERSQNETACKLISEY